MRAKYVAAVALLAWLLVVVWLSSMVIAKPAVLRFGNQAGETAEIAELRKLIARNRQTMEALGSLRSSSPYLAHAQPVALPASGGAAAAATASGVYGGAGTGAEAEVPHQVSLVLLANGRRVAVVDGQHVSVGSLLAGGARVAAIGPDWVRIARPGSPARTYKVPHPLAKAAPSDGMR